MKQRLSLLVLCGLFATGCDPSSNNGISGISAAPTASATPTATPSPTPVADDLDILNGTQLLATGHDATGTANAPANCATQLAFLPKKLKGWVVAFGISSFPTYFSYCSMKITCTAGDQYPVFEDISNAGGTIAQFEAGSPSSVYNTEPFVCPQSGSDDMSISPGSTSNTMIRLQLVKLPSQTVVDTEYAVGSQ